MVHGIANERKGFVSHRWTCRRTKAISAARLQRSEAANWRWSSDRAMAEDAAMEEARDEYGRLKGEAHTSGRLRGADMLDASAAASSLFALQQVLQRE